MTLPRDTPPLPLKTVDDVVVGIAETINMVRVGRLDARVANAMGVLFGTLLKALEGSDLERRIAALEGQRISRNGRVLH
jgi:hypothetical protein